MGMGAVETKKAAIIAARGIAAAIGREFADNRTAILALPVVALPVVAFPVALTWLTYTGAQARRASWQRRSACEQRGGRISGRFE